MHGHCGKDLIRHWFPIPPPQRISKDILALGNGRQHRVAKLFRQRFDRGQELLVQFPSGADSDGQNAKWEQERMVPSGVIKDPEHPFQGANGLVFGDGWDYDRVGAVESGQALVQ